MSATEDVHVSLPTDVLEWARQKAAQNGKTVSEVLSEALEQQRQSEAVMRYLAQFPDDATPADLAAVEAEWR
jgi:hypothetical protein